MGSFKDFVHSLADDVTPEEAIAKFAEHRETLAKRGLEAFKRTGLFCDMYHPLAALRRLDLRACLAQRSAQSFIQDLRSSRYAGCALRAPPPADGCSQSGKCPVVGHMQAPHFVFDPDVNALSLGAMPCTLSLWNLYDSLAQCPGFLAVSVAQPLAGDLSREFRVRFASKGEAHAAVATLAKNDVRTNGVAHALRADVLAASSEMSALVVPPEMSNPERISKDHRLSASIVRHLDKVLGIEPEATEELLSMEGTPEQKLDLQVLYLRRVHHFCFYSAEWCADEWELRRECGLAIVRCHMAADAAPVEEGEWAAKHERRLEACLTSARLDYPRSAAAVEEAFEARTGTMLEQNMEVVQEGRWQCKRCEKLYKGPEYVQKHIRKAHPELIQAVYEELQQEAAGQALAADENRPRCDVLVPLAVA